MRAILVKLHRYLGLATAFFLAVAGLTGAILAFHHEIDEWLNPSFYATQGGGEPLPAEELVNITETLHPKLRVWYLERPVDGDHPALMAAVAKTDPATGQPYEVDYNWIYLDPVSGQQLGQRFWAKCCFEPVNFIPFIYELHYKLMLPEVFGVLLMGIVAILWVLDTLIALFLTFPRSQPFWKKWKTAWQMRFTSPYKINFDLHRAGGLWLWLILLPVAVSSVAMNLPTQVFKPLVSVFSPVAYSVYEQRMALPTDQLGSTLLDYGDAYQLAEEEAQRLGWEQPIGEMYYSYEYNIYGAGFGEHDANMLGNPWMFFHGTSGELLGTEVPGTGSAGDIFFQLQTPIHGGRILGLPGRILIAITGVGIAILSITGVIIWWRKFSARRKSLARSQQQVTS